MNGFNEVNFHNNLLHNKVIFLNHALVVVISVLMKFEMKTPTLSPQNLWQELPHKRTSSFCTDCGTYCISCSCLSMYIGKTTTHFNKRLKEHFQQSRTSAVLEHSKVCHVRKDKTDFSIQFLENMILS